MNAKYHRCKACDNYQPVFFKDYGVCKKFNGPAMSHGHCPNWEPDFYHRSYDNIEQSKVCTSGHR